LRQSRLPPGDPWIAQTALKRCCGNADVVMRIPIYAIVFSIVQALAARFHIDGCLCKPPSGNYPLGATLNQLSRHGVRYGG
jgi:hypothetical protein